jgi:hypothetical protein
MTEFILRIFFTGLIALRPSADGKEVTVLLVNTPHEYALADGTSLAHHMPVVVARAASCEGTCTTEDHASIAQFLYANKTSQQAVTALNGATLGGGAWLLSNSDLTLVGPNEPLKIRTNARGRTETGALQLVPTTPAEREDISWVAGLSDLAPSTHGFKAAVTSSEAPPGCMIVARLKLRSGKLFTYSLVKIDGKARPVHFRKPSGEGPEAAYIQAVANWVAAEIHVPGDVVEIVDQNFNDSAKRRSMKLHPQDGVVEIAVLNLPPFEPPAPDAVAPLPAPGQHFQIYYDLVKTPPARADRLVPFATSAAAAADPQVDWAALHPRQSLWSNLLEQLNLSPRGKSPYDLALCPITKE